MKTGDILVALAKATLASAAITIKSTDTNPKEVYDGYVSFSIELSSFPDFAGTPSDPNTFSDTLLENIGNIIGTRPYIRVGGNTQDFALYDASLTTAIKGVIDPAVSKDYPAKVTIGDKFFDSYGVWKNTKFSHGFNMAMANTADGQTTLEKTVPLACKALSGGKLYYWEYGNEPNLFPTNLDNGEYETDYTKGTDQIKDLIKQNCAGLANGGDFLAPSFSGAGTSLDAATVFGDGLDSTGDIKLFSTHNYISGATSPGVSLQGTLMNHGMTTQSVDAHITEYNSIANPPPLIFGETNSLYNEGAPGLSNSFGAALWGVDFNLYSASVGVKRVHMHQGTGYRYAAWQPVTANDIPKGTKAPYYGNIAVAAMLGNIIEQPPAIANIDLGDDQAAAYAAYIDGGKTLARVMVINLNAFNSTVNGAGVVPLTGGDLKNRGSSKYSFAVEGLQQGKKVSLQRLWAGGSDAISGCTWDGYTYNYEESAGKPVRLNNVTTGETVTAGNGGVVVVDVPDSSAVMINFVQSSSGSGSNVGLPNSGSPGSGSATDNDAQKSAGSRGKRILFWQL